MKSGHDSLSAHYFSELIDAKIYVFAGYIE
jgi:hypothetical protein